MAMAQIWLNTTFFSIIDPSVGRLRREKERPFEQESEHSGRIRHPPRSRPRLRGLESLRIRRFVKAPKYRVTCQAVSLVLLTKRLSIQAGACGWTVGMS